MPVVILTGASGSGKTTIAKAIAEQFRDEVEVLSFDSIGVPSTEAMIAEYGSPEGWQKAKTIDWMSILADRSATGRPILFEGQTRLAFLRLGAELAGWSTYVPLLVDCDDHTRTERLSVHRLQPELANPSMMNWAKYLRSEATAEGCEVLDTSKLSVADASAYVMRFLSPKAN